ncbi:arsenic transporter [Peribacillus saganii]|uniref:Arsenic transporter n=1 Tax=Peribacillus saganii TaxID=2303992 RepID=A0A372LIM8_9BACI|nr:arsenic transporter [Peribacillus saganii]RFU66187.1 arsenic transporter [Peribacillus saganii]
MAELTPFLTILSFVITMIFIFWRPKGINEAIPATAGAVLIFLCGSVSLADIGDIGTKVTGAAVTIMATMVMAIALESIGFFNWVAAKMLKASKGSGIRLFWLTNMLCFLMTLFLNNDGSILITTPILILLLRNLGLKNHQKLPYLISGALIATASSAPIGVSNIVNLIALEIIGMDLYLHTAMMFVPGTLGLLFLTFLLYIIFYREMPKKIPFFPKPIDYSKLSALHPLQSEPDRSKMRQQTKLMVSVLAFVLLVRISLFVASYYSISVSMVAVVSSIILLGWRWWYLKISPLDLLKKIPWHIFVFAFTMYVIVYGLHNIGLTTLLISYIEPIVSSSLFNATLVMGTILSVLSNIFNNHPALMIGTMALTEMGLDPITLKTIYLANIIGSDMGSLLLPTGTLATLIWMHILRGNQVKISWSKYIGVTILAIPLTVAFTLTILYFWVDLIFY